MEYDICSNVLARVKIRRDFKFPVKPSAEQIDGKLHVFSYGWIAEPDEMYAGEVTWMPHYSKWPEGAPSSIASGDLEIICDATPIRDDKLGVTGYAFDADIGDDLLIEITA